MDLICTPNKDFYIPTYINKLLTIPEWLSIEENI